MRLDQLEQMRRSPMRSPVRDSKPAATANLKSDSGDANNDNTSRKKLKLDSAATAAAAADQKEEANASSAVTPTDDIEKSSASADEKQAKKAPVVAAASLKSTNDDDDDAAIDASTDWKYIDKVESILFQFQENEDTSSLLPYSLEVIWIHNDHEYYVENTASATGDECSEKFIPLIKEAVKKAKHMKSFMVRYNNQLDRTWPYTKVSRIAEVVSKVKGVDATLESVEEDYFEYIVNLVPKSGKNKRKMSGASFAGSVDFSNIDDMKKYYILDYIGGGALSLL